MVSHKGANELMLRHLPEPPSFQERIIGRVQAYTAGYDHDVDLISHLAAAPGVQLTVYSTPDSLRAVRKASSRRCGLLSHPTVWERAIKNQHQSHDQQRAGHESAGRVNTAEVRPQNTWAKKLIGPSR